MNRLDRALIDIRVLRQRVDKLEAALAARSAPRKRERAPRPDDAVVTARQTLWARLVLLHVQYGHGRLTKLRFVIKYHLGDPSDFSRFINGKGKRTIAEHSVPATRYYAALNDLISELEARRDSHAHSNSHGIGAGSQFSGAQLH